MEYPRIVGDGDVHRTRIANRQPEVGKDLNRAEELAKTVVKLKFEFDGALHTGTGFFVNFPSTKYDVILTAAHNLIHHNKARAQNLKVVYSDGVEEDVKRYIICPQYEDVLALGPEHPDRGLYDYGVILLPKEDVDSRLGLGLNLGFNLQAQSDRNVNVSGFGDGPGALRTSSGDLQDFGRQLMYKAQTEQGMSGSPVWIAYDGQRIAIGIHNMKAISSVTGSRGTKITEEVFRNLCAWTETGFFNKRLYAPKVKGKKHNTYLSFSQHSDFAKVFLGTPDAAAHQDNLTFDIMPVYLYTKRLDGRSPSPLYAFKFHKPPAWKAQKNVWVEWQPKFQRAILVEALKDVNLVKLLEKPGKGSGARRYYVFFPSPNGNVDDGLELRLHDGDRDEDDIEDGMTEYAGVSFGVFKGRDAKESRRAFAIE